MKIEQEAGVEQEFIPLNRTARRRAERVARHQKSPLAAKYEAADRSFHQADGVRSTAISEADGNPIRVIYQGQTLIFIPLAQSTRDLAFYAEKVGVRDNENLMLARTHRHDYYGTPIKSISLADLEAIELPLSQEDAQSIGSLFYRRSYYPMLERERRAQEVALYLPIEAAVNAGKVSIPHKIRPLVNCLQAYFDYSIPFFTRPDIDPENEYNFLRHLARSGNRLLIKNLAAYLPARLGISPDSMVKLYEERKLTSSNGSIWWSINFLGDIHNGVEHAIPAGTLPTGFLKYLKFDKKNNQRAVKILQPAYASSVFSQLRGETTPVYLEKTAALLGEISDTLREDIFRSQGGFISIKPDRNPVISEILVTCHNKNAGQSYRKGFIFVLKLKDGQTHLTVEVKDERRLFGIPGQLVKENPHAGDFIAQDIVLATLESIRQKHPKPDRGELTTPYRLRRELPVTQNSFRAVPTDIPIIDEPTPKSPKIKTRGIPFLKVAPLPIFPHPEEELRVPEFTVLYTEALIQGLLPGKTRDPKTISRLVNDVAKFESGQADLYRVEEARKRGIVLLAQKSGDYRILYMPKSEGVFVIAAILDRSEYNNKGLGNLIDKIK